MDETGVSLVLMIWKCYPFLYLFGWIFGLSLFGKQLDLPLDPQK